MKTIDRILGFLGKVPSFEDNSSTLAVGSMTESSNTVVFHKDTNIICEGSLTISTKGHLFLNSNIQEGKKLLLNTPQDENGEPILEEEDHIITEYDHEHDTIDELREMVISLQKKLDSAEERILFLERKLR